MAFNKNIKTETGAIVKYWKCTHHAMAHKDNDEVIKVQFDGYITEEDRQNSASVAYTHVSYLKGSQFKPEPFTTIMTDTYVLLLAGEAVDEAGNPDTFFEGAENV